MLKFIVSYIISHGMLDYLTYTDINDVFNYIFLIILNYFIFYISSDFIFLVFLLCSMYHFGEDFRYLITGDYLDRSAGILLLSSIILVTGMDDVCDILSLDCDLFNKFITVMYIFSIVAIQCCSIKIKFISIPLILLPYAINPYNEFIGYLAVIHVPTAIYRYYKCYGIDIIYAWLFFIILIYCFIQNIINPFIIKFTISLLNVHMLYITEWQNKK